MKQLQKNFTTVEQSKRLLEMGIPADSADMFRIREDTLPIVKAGYESNVEFPCWSIGRLMEIFDLCYIDEPNDEYPNTWLSTTDKCIKNFGSYIEYIVQIFEGQSDYLDFSKLGK